MEVSSHFHILVTLIPGKLSQITILWEAELACMLCQESIHDSLIVLPTAELLLKQFFAL
jgi:hypothetical protein